MGRFKRRITTSAPIGDFAEKWSGDIDAYAPRHLILLVGGPPGETGAISKIKNGRGMTRHPVRSSIVGQYR
jgi:hypothetical protein